MILWCVILDVCLALASWIKATDVTDGNEKLLATALPAAATTAAGLNRFCLGDSKLSSSSSSIGLFGVMATVSLKHKQAQKWRFASISVKTETKNCGSNRSFDKPHPSGWQNYKGENNHIKWRVLLVTTSLWTLIVIHTHSIPSINGVSGQSFSGNRCKIFPLRLPDPETTKCIHWKTNRLFFFRLAKFYYLRSFSWS